MTESKSAGAKEVWITGIGIVSSLGEGLDAHWDALNAKTINIDDKRFSPYIVHPLAPVSFDAQIPKKGDQRQMEAWQRIGTYAAGLALDSAGLKGNKEILGRMDMIVAAGGGERDLAVDESIMSADAKGNSSPGFLNERLMNDLRPTLFLAQLSNLLAGNIAIVHGVCGTSRTFMGEEAASIDAARIALARRTSISQRDTEKLTRSKYEAGSGNAVALAKATAQAASTEANVPTYQAALAADIHRLGILLGRPPDGVASLMATSAPVPAPRMPLPTGLPADLLMSRPDVASAERKLAQATAKIGAAEADRYPAVSLTGSVGTSALRAGDLAKYSSVSWSVGPSVTVPVFDAGKRLATVKIAEAQRDQAFATFHSTLLTALEDVENALVSISQERVRGVKLAEAAKNYREAARLSRSLFETGSASFIDVLDAERSLYSAEDSLIQSKVSAAKDYISLAKALGGGWSDPVDISTPIIVDTNTGPHFRETVK